MKGNMQTSCKTLRWAGKLTWT